MSDHPVTIGEIRDAARRIRGIAHRSPVVTCSTLDRLAGRELFFKCELFQKGGAFKFRGATNALMKLTDEEARRGVVTHSSGNHAQALALAARTRGVPAHIVMPRTASRVKRDAVRDYGGRIIECDPTLSAREETAERVRRETGAFHVPPYDHPDVIAGQGTVALELIEDVPDLDAVVAPIGGGGLISGIAIAAGTLRPRIRIFGGEPAGADDAFRSKKLGRLVPQTTPQTIADGLLTGLGELTWPIIRDRVESVLCVSDDEIVSAMRLLWERAKLLAEPSAAVPLAAVLGTEFRSMPGMARVGVVLSGGNVDLERLPWR